MTINCSGKLIDLTTPKVMGILNVTPDSFYDGGQNQNEARILEYAAKLIGEGTNFIDVGGYSSRPGASEISIEEETSRVVPAIKAIISYFPDAIISIDTFRSEVARAAVQNGAAIINDISAGNLDRCMFETVAELKVPFIMMHMLGDPQTMQGLANYKDVVSEMLLYFSERIAIARNFGIDDLILDPGFGFAKTLEQNYEVLNKLELFSIAHLPLLVGFSRKSMVYKPLNLSTSQALNGTTVLNTIALTKGAKILRVHDVKEAVECVKLFNQLSVIDDDTAHFSGL